MPSPFPCSPVMREWSWKKTQIEKKRKPIYLFNCIKEHPLKTPIKRTQV